MKKALFLLVAVLTIVSMSACRIEKVYDNKEPLKTYNLKLSGFSSLSNAGDCDVHFIQSATYKVTLKASQRWYDRHDIRVDDGTLVIGTKGYKKLGGVSVINMSNYDNEAEIWVSAPNLNDVSMSGSGDFSLDSDFMGKSLNMDVRGSSDAKLRNVTLSGDFTYTVSGSGDVEIGTVKARGAKFSIFGSGDVDAKLANVANTAVDVHGSGDVDLKFSNCGNADVTVMGSGDVDLSGQLRTLSKQISGSGDVETSKLRLGR